MKGERKRERGEAKSNTRDVEVPGTLRWDMPSLTPLFFGRSTDVGRKSSPTLWKE